MDEAAAAALLAGCIGSHHHSPATEVPSLPYAVLHRWTDGFVEEKKLGEGALSAVYEGIAPLAGLLAVKRLSTASDAQQRQGEADDPAARLQRELCVLRAFRHPNIIRLYAYSHDRHPDLDADLNRNHGLCQGQGQGPAAHVCLVYEQSRRGGLDGHYVDDDSAARLTWQRRLGIASGVAAALHCLHSGFAGAGTGTGGGAYHRDVRSAHVTLALDYAPKLVGFGSAQFIPSHPVDTAVAANDARDGAANGANAEAGVVRANGADNVGVGPASPSRLPDQRLGTPGYRCPSYESSGQYDARSEVYSLGVVLSELLCGRLTGAPGTFFDRDAQADGALIADPRAGPWPQGLERDWAGLAGGCLARRAKRPGSVLPVLRALRELQRRHVGVGGGACVGVEGVAAGGVEGAEGSEGGLPTEKGCAEAAAGGGAAGAVQDATELHSLQRQLEALRIERSLGERDRREREQALRRECCACRDAASADRGVDCGHGHFFCPGCFQGYHERQLDAGRTEAFEQHGCNLVCEQCLNAGPAPVRVTPLAERASRACLDDETCARWGRARAAVLTRQVERRLERERDERGAREIAAAASLAARVLQHRQHIEGEVLSTRCPGCGGAILDFAGCFALACSREQHGGCGTQFCAFCLTVCPHGALGHVAACAENPNRGRDDSMFCRGAVFEERNKARMQRGLARYLALVPAAERGAVAAAVAAHVQARGLVMPGAGAGAVDGAIAAADGDGGDGGNVAGGEAREAAERAAREGALRVAPAGTGQRIFNAAKEGDMAALRPLVQEWSGHDVLNWANPDIRGWTPLIVGSHCGKVDAVRLLLATPGVLINKASVINYTALMASSKWGHNEIVRALLAVPGIDLNKRYTGVDWDWNGKTALGFAIMYKRPEAVALLRAAGAEEERWFFMRWWALVQADIVDPRLWPLLCLIAVLLLIAIYFLPPPSSPSAPPISRAGANATAVLPPAPAPGPPRCPHSSAAVNGSADADMGTCTGMGMGLCADLFLLMLRRSDEGDGASPAALIAAVEAAVARGLARALAAAPVPGV